MTNELLEQLESDLSIDIHDLENELTLQVDNYYDVSKNYRLSIDKRDDCKTALTEAKSTAYFEARDELMEEEGKATEAMIAAKTDRMDAVTKAQKKLDQAQSELNSWLALKEAYDQRSYALNKLVDLHISGYFGVAPALSAKEKSGEHKDTVRTSKYKTAKKKTKRKRNKV